MRSIQLLLAALLFYSSTGAAQNLVPNPGFEDIGTCPSSNSQSYELFRNATQHWYSPNIGSPDLFTPCSNPSTLPRTSVVPPKVFRGYQTARTGTNFTGFYHYGQTTEYLGNELSQALEAGKNYEITFYVSCAGRQSHITDQIGMYLSNTAVKDYTPGSGGSYPALTHLTPQIISTPGVFLRDTTWTKISGYYTAKGGEKFITIGCFFEPINSPHVQVLTSAVTPSWGNGEKRLYYFVDDVSIVPTISGALSLCAQASHTYSIAPVESATAYQWDLPAGWSGSSTSNTLSLTAGSNSGTITVTANDALQTTAQLHVQIETLAPTLSGNITGEEIICKSSSNTFSIVPASNASHYSWVLPQDWEGTSESNSIEITPNVVADGTISVQAHNACGNSDTKTYFVEVTDKPSAPEQITGAPIACENTTGQYSILPVANASSYTWQLPSGWSGSSMEASIVATTNTTSGTIAVAATNGCGSSATATYAVVIEAALNTSTLSITGRSGICAGDTATYTISSLGENILYQWQVPQGWQAVQEDTLVKLVAPSDNIGVLLSVSASNSCSATAHGNISIQVTDLTISVTEADGIVSTQYLDADHYQWLHCATDGYSPTGYNQASYAPSQSGSYALVVQQNDCIDTSACIPVVVTQTAIAATFDTDGWLYYPNPVSELLTVQLPVEATKQAVQLTLTSTDGKTFYETLCEKENQTNVLRIPVYTLPNGVYLLTIRSENFVINEKISILR